MTDQPLAHPLVIMIAPNGAYRTHADHPLLPVTIEETASVAAHCCEQGAALLHLHVRDDSGAHSLDADRYRAALGAIRKRVPASRLAVQVSTESASRFEPPQQMDLVRKLRPEFVSIALRELIPTPDYEQEAARFFAWLTRESIAVQYIIYVPRELDALRDYQARGIVTTERVSVQLALGSRKKPGTPPVLIGFLLKEPPTPWCACAFGNQETACAAATMAMGGHVRVGFENNLWRPDGQLREDNTEAVRQVVQLAALAGRAVADATKVRELFGLRGSDN